LANIRAKFVTYRKEIVGTYVSHRFIGYGSDNNISIAQFASIFSLTYSFCWIYLDSLSTTTYSEFAAWGGIQKLWTTRSVTKLFTRIMVWALSSKSTTES